jgi:hypothetical protein
MLLGIWIFMFKQGWMCGMWCYLVGQDKEKEKEKKRIEE